MVFETRVGETFVLGASTWRIEEITHDRVLVSPAPGEPGKMPFWKGDGPGGRWNSAWRSGALVRELARDAAPRRRAPHRGARSGPRGGREPAAATSPISERATRRVPDDRRSSSSAAATNWATGECACSRRSAARSTRRGRWLPRRASASGGTSTSRRCGPTTGSSCGSRTPTSRRSGLLLPPPDEVEPLVLRQLGGTALFAARFREVAARALLLPRRRPGRAHAALAAAQARGRSAGGRGAVRLVPGAARDLPRVPARRVRPAGAGRTCCAASAAARSESVTVDTDSPSPFASSLLFGYVANFIYDGDAPLAERRAQALLVDQAQLRDLLGDVELRELLDPAVIDEVEQQLQRLDARLPGAQPRTHCTTCCCAWATSTRTRLRARCEIRGGGPDRSRAGRPSGGSIELRVAGEPRFVAVEDVAGTATRWARRCRSGCRRRFSTRCRSGRRSRPALRADARAVHGRGRCGALRTAAAPSPRAPRAAAARGRVLQGAFTPGRARPRVVRGGRAAADPAALAGEAAAGGRTGERRGARAG